MRQKLLIVLLSVCATLLAVNLHVALRTPDLPFALGQSVGAPTGQVAIATATTQGGNESMVFLYDVASQRLLAYACKNQGLELKGVRQITWDLQIEELSAALASRRLDVDAIRKEIKKKATSGAKPAPAPKGKEKAAPPEEPEEPEETEEEAKEK